MRSVGEIRVSGSINIPGIGQYTTDPADLKTLYQQVKAKQVWYQPAIIYNDDQECVGAMFPGSQFQETGRLVLFIGQVEYQIRGEDFLRVMAENQFAAQIFDMRHIEAVKGQATLAECLS